MKFFRFSVAASLLLVGLALPAILLAQGVTTGAMNGLVTDETGEPLPGANVIAVHEPSGTQYGAATRTGGLYDLPHLRIGGPYTVTVTFIGYRTEKEENVYIALG
ncbi:MAG: carboxypeptidase-like regulatory domain-containing protein, partial [Bacteroidota bacterium]